MLKQITILAVAMALASFDVEAKRVGGGRSSGAQRPAAAKQAPQEEDTKASISIRAPRVNVSAPSRSVAPQAPAAAPAVVTVPAAAAASGAAAAPAATDPEALRLENEQKLLRAAQEDEKRRELEEKRAAAIAAYEKEQAEERQRMIKVAQQREAARLKNVRESQCQFKPVMTDDDIARCRAVYR
jgi:hypothetical protein